MPPTFLDDDVAANLDDGELSEPLRYGNARTGAVVREEDVVGEDPAAQLGRVTWLTIRNGSLPGLKAQETVVFRAGEWKVKAVRRLSPRLTRIAVARLAVAEVAS